MTTLQSMGHDFQLVFCASNAWSPKTHPRDHGWLVSSVRDFARYKPSGVSHPPWDGTHDGVRGAKGASAVHPQTPLGRRPTRVPSPLRGGVSHGAGRRCKESSRPGTAAIPSDKTRSRHFSSSVAMKTHMKSLITPNGTISFHRFFFVETCQNQSEVVCRRALLPKSWSNGPPYAEMTSEDRSLSRQKK